VNGVFPVPWCAGDLSLPTPAAGGGTLLTGHSMSSCTNANSIGYDHLINGGNSSIRFYSFVNGGGSLSSATNTPLVNQPATHGGYFVFVRGDRTVTNTGSGVTTMRPKGTINQGDTVVTVDQTYQVVGNPYPAQINLDDMYNNGDNNTAITSNFWVWDSNLGVDGGYRFLSRNEDEINYTVIPEPDPGMTDNDYLIVNSGQAFFVERNGETGGPITISEEDKVTGGNGNTPMFRVSNQSAARINVRLYRASGTTLQTLMDGTGARFADGYSTATNEVYDVYKANQTLENIALNRNLTKYMSIESRPFPVVNDTLFLTFYRTTVRDYALRINTREFEGLNYNVVLLDAFTGSETVIPQNGQDLIYPFKVTSAAASSDFSRFKIVLRTSVVTPVTNLPVVKGVEMYPSLVAKGGTTKLMLTNKQSGAYQVNLYSMLGVRVLSQTIRHGGGTGSYFMELPQQLAAGTYTAEIKGVNGEVKNVKLVIH
jgi:hypothetical protein